MWRQGLETQAPGFRSQSLPTAICMKLLRCLSWPSPYCWPVRVTVFTLLGCCTIEWDNSSGSPYLQECLTNICCCGQLKQRGMYAGLPHAEWVGPCSMYRATLLREGAELEKCVCTHRQGCSIWRKGGVSRAQRCKHTDQPCSDPLLAAELKQQGTPTHTEQPCPHQAAPPMSAG